VRALIERVAVVIDPSLHTTQVRVEAVADGRTRVAEYDTGVPAADLDAQGAKLRTKFSNLVEPLIGDDAKALAERIEDLTALPSARQLVSSRRRTRRWALRLGEHVVLPLDAVAGRRRLRVSVVVVAATEEAAWSRCRGRGPW
jgi:hypothetical protein